MGPNYADEPNQLFEPRITPSGLLLSADLEPMEFYQEIQVEPRSSGRNVNSVYTFRFKLKPTSLNSEETAIRSKLTILLDDWFDGWLHVRTILWANYPVGRIHMLFKWKLILEYGFGCRLLIGMRHQQLIKTETKQKRRSFIRDLRQWPLIHWTKFCAKFNAISALLSLFGVNNLSVNSAKRTLVPIVFRDIIGLFEING